MLRHMILLDHVPLTFTKVKPRALASQAVDTKLFEDCRYLTAGDHTLYHDLPQHYNNACLNVFVSVMCLTFMTNYMYVPCNIIPYNSLQIVFVAVVWEIFIGHML